MKTIIALALATLTLTACGSRNLNDCLADAAKAPTEQGVKIATYSCYQKFPNQ